MNIYRNAKTGLYVDLCEGERLTAGDWHKYPDEYALMPVLEEIRRIDANTFCILTDHEFSAQEARETLAQLKGSVDQVPPHYAGLVGKTIVAIVKDPLGDGIYGLKLNSGECAWIQSEAYSEGGPGFLHVTRYDEKMTTMIEQQLADAIRARGYAVSVEYPGYILFGGLSEVDLAFGFTNGNLGWQMMGKDGKVIDGAGEEFAGTSERSPIGELAQLVVETIEGNNAEGGR